MQVQLPSNLFEAINYIGIGIISILYGFIGAGRDGLMYDMRVLRGIHRTRWNVMVYIFSVYSILLSVSQWSISVDCSDHVTFTNETHTGVINNTCSNLVYGSMWLWIALLVLDAIYIITLISQRDYRSKATLKEQIEVRRTQRKQFVLSLVVLCMRLVVHVVRFALMVTAVPLVAATFINAFLIVWVVINVVIHVRAISIYTFTINDWESRDIVDTSSSKYQPNQRQYIPPESDDDDDDDEEEDVKHDTKPILPIKTSRPQQRIR